VSISPYKEMDNCGVEHRDGSNVRARLRTPRSAPAISHVSVFGIHKSEIRGTRLNILETLVDTPSGFELGRHAGNVLGVRSRQRIPYEGRYAALRACRNGELPYGGRRRPILETGNRKKRRCQEQAEASPDLVESRIRN